MISWGRSQSVRQLVRFSTLARRSAYGANLTRQGESYAPLWRAYSHWF